MMGNDVAPWLHGLDMDVTWDQPLHVSSASHDANSLTRINRQASGTWNNRLSRQSMSMSGAQRLSGTPHNSQHQKRTPLAIIDSNDQVVNACDTGAPKLHQLRSSSLASHASMEKTGTVQQRAKSTSPAKKQETLEWKRRLMHGHVGYGDQTDLFGPSGLENIFAQTHTLESGHPTTKTRPAWMNRPDHAPIPSSPLAWSPASGVVPKFESEARLEKEKNTGDGVANRTIGGQTELEQEDFSPVYISKHTTQNGSIGYKTLDSHTTRRHHKRHVSEFQKIQQAALQKVEEPSFHAPTESVPPSLIHGHPPSDCALAAPDFSLSENLPTGTPPVLPLNHNVEFNQVRHSAGSFKQKLSSSTNSVISEPRAFEASIIESVLSTPGQIYPPAPTPPRARPVITSHVSPTPEPQGTSFKSPLKLFGTHDTFTNSRLLRRMSTLDIDQSIATSDDTDPPTAHVTVAPAQVRQYEGSFQVPFDSGDQKTRDSDAEVSTSSATDSKRDNGEHSPGSEIAPPGSKTPVHFRIEPEDVTSDPFKLKSRISKGMSKIPRPITADNTPRKEVLLNAPVSHSSQNEAQPNVVIEKVARPVLGAGKRPQNSPHKDSTPKRRRTLHISDFIDHALEATDRANSSPKEKTCISKRSDARPDNATSKAEPETFPQAKLLRPRSAIPNQDRRQQIQMEICEATEQFVAEEPERLEAVIEQIESSLASGSPPSMLRQAQTVANEVAKFTLRVQKASGDFSDIVERKRSVTTQDFFNEAVMVMKLIRERAGRQSALGSLAESNQERHANSEIEDQSAQDNSALSVSRPPSREGGVAWRPRMSHPTNARVVSHLRKFAERDDTDYLAPSYASFNAKDNDDDDDDDDCDEEYEKSVLVAADEHASTQVKDSMPLRVQRVYVDTDCRPISQQSEPSTLDSQSTRISAVPSAGTTRNTASSRKSENVGTLAPDAVAHLIGEHVGSMTFDKEKLQWRKAKHNLFKQPNQGSLLEIPSSISTSDEDPFREISDLPVDREKEEQIRTASFDFKHQLEAEKTSAQQPQMCTKSMTRGINFRTRSNETVVARPRKGESSRSHRTHTASDLSRHTVLTSNEEDHVETGATSWSHPEVDYILERVQEQGLGSEQIDAPCTLRTRRANSETVGQAILASAEKDAESSSVLDQSIQDDEPVRQEAKDGDSLREDTVYNEEISSIKNPNSLKLRPTATKAISTKSGPFHDPIQQVVTRRHALARKFRNETLEQSELSFLAKLPSERTLSVSLSVSRPVTSRQTIRHVLAPQSSPSRTDSSFLLSDLPDFTMREEDEERPSERALANRLARYAASEVNDRYAIAMRDLVKTLTDVQKDELYWEDLEYLDLRGRNMTSLYGLSDFCSDVQEVDVSENSLTHLDGAPTSLRQLSARLNHLSNLTSWAHLMNLQYLDISGNNLSDLEGLACLVHLRELRADDNAIKDIKGIMRLDGLLHLRLRRNKVRHLDFSGCRLHRLENLDMIENEITEIEHIETLGALHVLKLDGNPIKRPLCVERILPRLRHLSLRNCSLESLTVSCMPALRELFVDDNRLQRIVGAEILNFLEILSMRRQTLPGACSVTVLEQAINARTIFLSGSNLISLRLPQPLLSLQHLEMAAVGLQELPNNLGMSMPNLKILNLNFNALNDIKPLLNVHSLERLTVCGNRLSRLRKSVATLAKMPTLNALDLRDNPLTLRYYAPRELDLRAKQTSVVQRVQASGLVVEDEDVLRDEIESARYTLPGPDMESDRQYHSRLDEDMKLRRRVYKLMLGNSCSKLSTLDGLPFDKTEAMVKDDVWERLVELDIVRKSNW